MLGLLDHALTLQTTLLLRATQLRASALHVDRENNYTASTGMVHSTCGFTYSVPTYVNTFMHLPVSLNGAHPTS